MYMNGCLLSAEYIGYQDINTPESYDMRLSVYHPFMQKRMKDKIIDSIGWNIL